MDQAALLPFGVLDRPQLQSLSVERMVTKVQPTSIYINTCIYLLALVLHMKLLGASALTKDTEQHGPSNTEQMVTCSFFDIPFIFYIYTASPARL